MDKFKDWDIFELLPKGWKIDKMTGSPLFGHVFITNGKSVLNGQERALLRVKMDSIGQKIEHKESIIEKAQIAPIEKEDYVFPAKTVNILARKKFQEQLLKEISVDLIICEIEGWDMREYIKELQKLIGGIKLPKRCNKIKNNSNQLDIFN